MQLTLHADYALRVLLYLAAHPDKPVPTQEIGRAYGISKHHLVRVVQTLNDNGYVTVVSGRFGGAVLARPAEQIRIGDVVRSAETNLKVVECFDAKTNTCVIAPVCRLKGMLQEALTGFMSVLDTYTLADIVAGNSRAKLIRLFTANSGA